MSAQEMEIKVNELRELRRMADELAAEITALEDGIKLERQSCFYFSSGPSGPLHKR